MLRYLHKSEIESQSAPLATVATYHLEQASALLSEHHLMAAGPTGETNRLYAAGRGVALVIVDDCEEKVPALQTAMARLLLRLWRSNSVNCAMNDRDADGVADAAKSTWRTAN